FRKRTQSDIAKSFADTKSKQSATVLQHVVELVVRSTTTIRPGFCTRKSIVPTFGRRYRPNNRYRHDGFSRQRIRHRQRNTTICVRKFTVRPYKTKSNSVHFEHQCRNGFPQRICCR